MNDNFPLVSIVMPAYNAEAFIAESILSVQSQSYENWELLIINDNSTDGTPPIAEDFQNTDARIELIRLPTNQGTGFARNVGIKAARGQFICFLDADDLWQPQKLQVQVEFMLKNDLSVSYSAYELMDEMGNSIGKIVTARRELNLKKMLKANYIGNLTGMYDAGKVGKIYCPPIRKRQDWALWIKAVEKAGIARGTQQPLAKYRLRKDSISRNKLEMLGYNYKVYREVLKYSRVKSSILFCQFLFEQFLVKSRQTVPLKK